MIVRQHDMEDSTLQLAVNIVWVFQQRLSKFPENWLVLKERNSFCELAATADIKDSEKHTN